MRIHTIITHLILSALITTSINAYASDWQISRIIKNQVFLIPIDSIRDTGIASKSAKIVAINRDRICVIEYYQAHTGLTKPKSVDPYGNLMLTSTSPWDLASYSIEVDCDTNQYRYIEPVKYFYNGEFIKDDSPISEGDGWMSSKKSTNIYEGDITHDTDISEHANLICSRPTKYKSIKNLKSNATNLNWRELVLLGRDILNNKDNYYLNKTNKFNKKSK